MKRSILGGLLMLLFSVLNIYAQEEELTDSIELKPKYGIFGAYNINIHSSSLRKFDIIPSCCPEYNTGFGQGFTTGILFDYPFTSEWQLNLRASYALYNGLMTSREIKPVIIDGISQNGIFEHRLNSKLSTIGIEPMAGYRFWNNMTAHAGFRVGWLINKYIDQMERIVEPADKGTYSDGRRFRNIYTGNIPENSYNPLQIAFTAGLSYDLPLNPKEYLFISPEIFYTFWLTSIVKEAGWRVHSIRGGLAIKYNQPPPPPPPPPPPLPPPYPEIPLPPPPPGVTASLNVVRVDSSKNENPNFNLKIEDFISLNMRPLLNYIFFDSNSAEIPSRYKKLSQQETYNFSVEKMHSIGVLPTYYQVMNIIGKRMRQKPDAVITIIGNNCNTGGEKGNKDLSKMRAESVRNYLRDIWSIPEKNMKIQYQNLPKEHSKNDDVQGQEENRRVEIVSKDMSINEPVLTTDTLRKINRYNLRFYPKATAEAGIHSWSINVIQNNRDLAEFKGSGNLPDKIDWALDDGDTSAPLTGGQISYTMSVRDSMGQTATTPVQRIPVEQLTIDKKKLERIQDKEFEYYSLILFDYGKANLGSEHKKVLDIIENRITPQSTVVISGYADSMGDEEVNKKLSSKRAEAAAKRLGIKKAEIKGVGEEVLLYDNTLPEGRFYCRTVKLTIETPVADNK